MHVWSITLAFGKGESCSDFGIDLTSSCRPDWLDSRFSSSADEYGKLSDSIFKGMSESYSKIPNARVTPECMCHYCRWTGREGEKDVMFYLFIFFYLGFGQVLQPTKDFKFGQYLWKVADKRKNPWCTKTASNLQPSDLCLNAYRSLPGDQDIFSLLFSCIYIYI